MNKDKLQNDFMDFWDEYKDKVGLGNYSDEVTRFWLEKMEEQEAEILSVIQQSREEERNRLKKVAQEYRDNKLKML